MIACGVALNTPAQGSGIQRRLRSGTGLSRARSSRPHLLLGSYDDVRARIDAYLAADDAEVTTGETRPADSETQAKD